MSQENVEVLRRVSAAFNSRDWDHWLSLLYPDIVYYDDASLAIDTPTVMRGHDQLLMGIRSLAASKRAWRSQFSTPSGTGDS
jgi:hypothetical protein